MALPTSSVGEGPAKKQCPLPAFLSGRKLPLQLSSWSYTTEFLPGCQQWDSEPVGLSKSMGRLFKKVLHTRNPQSHWATIQAGFCSQKLWGLLFLALWAWDGRPVWGWDLLLRSGDVCIWEIPPSVCSPHVSVGPALRHVLPSCQTRCGCILSLLWDFCSVRFPVVLNDDCWVVQL